VKPLPGRAALLEEEATFDEGAHGGPGRVSTSRVRLGEHTNTGQAHMSY